MLSNDLQVRNDTKQTCRRCLIKRIRIDEERERMAVSQQKYYASKKEKDPELVYCCL